MAEPEPNKLPRPLLPPLVPSSSVISLNLISSFLVVIWQLAAVLFTLETCTAYFDHFLAHPMFTLAVTSNQALALATVQR